MSKKKKQEWGGMVYSTNSEYRPEIDDSSAESINANQQDLRVWFEKRNGKASTVVRGFIGPELELKLLGKELRVSCSCGGSEKNGEIILQGDVRDKVIKILSVKGYKSKKAGG